MSDKLTVSPSPSSSASPSPSPSPSSSASPSPSSSVRSTDNSFLQRRGATTQVNNDRSMVTQPTGPNPKYTPSKQNSSYDISRQGTIPFQNIKDRAIESVESITDAAKDAAKSVDKQSVSKSADAAIVIANIITGITPIVSSIPGAGIAFGLLNGVLSLTAAHVARTELGKFFIENATTITLMVKNNCILRELTEDKDGIKDFFGDDIIAQTKKAIEHHEINRLKRHKDHILLELKSLNAIIDSNMDKLLLIFAKCIIDENKFSSNNATLDLYHKSAFHESKDSSVETGTMSKLLHYIKNIPRIIARMANAANSKTDTFNIITTINSALTNLTFMYNIYFLHNDKKLKNAINKANEYIYIIKTRAADPSNFKSFTEKLLSDKLAISDFLYLTDTNDLDKDKDIINVRNNLMKREKLHHFFEDNMTRHPSHPKQTTYFDQFKNMALGRPKTGGKRSRQRVKSKKGKKGVRRTKKIIS